MHLMAVNRLAKSAADWVQSSVSKGTARAVETATLTLQENYCVVKAAHSILATSHFCRSGSLPRKGSFSYLSSPCFSKNVSSF